MLENLYSIIQRTYIGAILVMTGTVLHAQTTPQNCNNTDPGVNAGDIGCVSFTYQGQQVSYATVRGADGKIWLQQNLGSSQVATAVADEDSYGDLFQWGRWDDGHQLRTSPTGPAPAQNTPVGITSGSYITGSPAWWANFADTDKWIGKTPEEAKDYIGVDPCKAVGNDWKMPAQTDWEALIGAENIINPATAYSSHLKLPAGGYRGSGNGNFTFVGQRGYFWSSDTSGLGGKYLYVGNILANPSAGGPRGQGASVRCVKPQSALGTVDTQSKNFTIGIVPNPTHGILTVKADTTIENITVINTIGQKIDAKISDNRIDLTAFPKGLYMVELKLKNGQTVVKKIMKD